MFQLLASNFQLCHLSPYFASGIFAVVSSLLLLLPSLLQIYAHVHRTSTTIYGDVIVAPRPYPQIYMMISSKLPAIPMEKKKTFAVWNLIHFTFRTYLRTMYSHREYGSSSHQFHHRHRRGTDLILALCAHCMCLWINASERSTASGSIRTVWTWMSYER